MGAGLGKQKYYTEFWREFIWMVRNRASDNISKNIE
jgi:hypothetical protein